MINGPMVVKSITYSTSLQEFVRQSRISKIQSIFAGMLGLRTMQLYYTALKNLRINSTIV